jgi:hypothetical protein
MWTWYTRPNRVMRWETSRSRWFHERRKKKRDTEKGGAVRLQQNIVNSRRVLSQSKHILYLYKVVETLSTKS